MVHVDLLVSTYDALVHQLLHWPCWLVRGERGGGRSDSGREGTHLVPPTSLLDQWNNLKVTDQVRKCTFLWVCQDHPWSYHNYYES